MSFSLFISELSQIYMFNQYQCFEKTRKKMMIRRMDAKFDKTSKRVANAAEAARLRALWDAAPNRLSQAEFGEAFNIGGQSAVGNFLSGASPLSLKAATGFARGLGVAIEQFSPRLAGEAKAIAATLGPMSGPSLPKHDLVETANTQSQQGHSRKFLVSVFDPETERQIGMITLSAESLSDAHARGLRLIQRQEIAKHLDADHVFTAVVEVYSLRPADWD